jgi:hypothetical protein
MAKDTVLSVLREIRSLLKKRLPVFEVDLNSEAWRPTFYSGKVDIAARFVDNGDGTITDRTTGLMWSKNPHTDLPEKFKGTMVWKDVITAYKELSFAGHNDWRLPTVEELRSIVDYTRGAKENEPAIDTKFFPDTKCSWYRTSTPCAFSEGSVWCVNFYYGNVSFVNKDYLEYVRPVRSSQ